MHIFFRFNNFATPSKVKSINSFDVGRPKNDFYFILTVAPEDDSSFFE